MEEVKYCINPPWGKIFLNSFIKNNHIQFDEVFTANDVMFSVKSGHLANKILIDTNYLYCSTTRSDSLDFQYSYNHIRSRFKVALDEYKYLSQIGKPQFRMNIVYFIAKIKKQVNNLNWTKYYLLPTFKTMKFRHIVIDLFQILINKLSIKITFNMKDMISIVVPCYNQAQYLEETQSVLDQTYESGNA